MSEVRVTKRLHKVDSLEEVKLQNNHILCRELIDNLSTPTKAGIYKGAVEFHKDQFLASHANRVHEVVKTCKELTFWSQRNKLSGNGLRWKTTLQVEVGDTVWLSYPSVIDYDGIICGGEEFRIINYAEVRLAKKPDGSVVLANGWILYCHPQKPRSSILIDPNPVTDWSRGVVYMLGERNTGYVVNEKKWVDIEDNINVSVGDVFIKDNPANKLLLEDYVFRYFDDRDLYLILRKNIVAIL